MNPGGFAGYGKDIWGLSACAGPDGERRMRNGDKHKFLGYAARGVPDGPDACLMTFIPYLGTIISMVPALLLALLVSPITVLYVLLLYLGAHALEGYLITPLVQSRTVRLIPGWLIMSELVGGLAAGILGVLIAAPLLVTITIVVQLLYVEDVLGDSMRVLGESREGFVMRRIAARLAARARRHRRHQ